MSTIVTSFYANCRCLLTTETRVCLYSKALDKESVNTEKVARLPSITTTLNTLSDRN